MIRFLKCLLPVMSLLLLVTLSAQEQKKGLRRIEQAVAGKEFTKADSIWTADVNSFLSGGNIDTLIRYIPLKGAITEGLEGRKKVVKALYGFINRLEEHRATPGQLLIAYRQMAEYLEGKGQLQEAYDASNHALKQVRLVKEKSEKELAVCEYNLGVYANYLGDVDLSRVHHRKALRIRENSRNKDAEGLYMSYNAMGGIMWYASKYDSAGYFFDNALKSLRQMPRNALNSYYRPANIYNNMAAVYSATGKTSEAVAAMQATIDHFQRFIASPGTHPKKESARQGVCQAIDNLAGIYKEIGDYDKAGNLLRYSYQQKKRMFGAEHPDVFISEILLGQHYNALRNYDSATRYLSSGLDKLERAEGDYLFWAADGWHNLAMVHENTGSDSMAAYCYDRSEALYEQSYQGSYDNIYMDFLRSASLFYARNDKFNKAYARAKKIRDYLRSIGEEQSLQGFYQLLNIAEIHYLTKRYKEAIRYSGEALSTVNNKMKAGSTALDSVKIEAFKPRVILIQSKARYALRSVKDSAFLQALSLTLDTALQVLENHKVLIDDAESISILMADHKELIDFAAKVALELYNKSYGSIYLEKFINLRESGLYNRIRSRLDRERAIQYSHIPTYVLQKERQLKESLRSSLMNNIAGDMQMNTYLKALNDWDAYLAAIRDAYPGYYNLRYATLFKSLPQLQHSLPAHTTLIRYYFTDTSSLVALVADKEHRRIVQINAAGVEQRLNMFLAHHLPEKAQLNLLHDLYNQLWSPLTPYIKQEKVIIIPDGVLYSLGFDMLPFEPVSAYKQLLHKGLLAKHAISYHYSIFMLGEQQRGKDIDANYVAFAPGFSDELKKEYSGKLKDSLHLDQSYMKLLPQPNTNPLAKKIRKLIGGDVYLENASTQTSFRKHAGNHKVIHIATHAEYNNINPERSGLIFAKDAGDNGSNRLYLSDIYNCDLSSDLTLLTACESGRPGYQDGEGMVSLAHAFNYAGSKNILTALWKIDEQSSSHITESFIKYTKDGMPTDEALRKSKLDYLQKAGGRLADPGYWSGLILMGVPMQVKFSPETDYTAGLIATGTLFACIAFFLLSRKRFPQKPA